MKKIILASAVLSVLLLAGCCNGGENSCKMERNGEGGISIEALQLFESDYRAVEGREDIEKNLAANSLEKVAMNISRAVATDTSFSHVIKEIGKTTDQYNSGRCWIFTTLNVYRAKIINKYGNKDFEFSHNYLFFYDQLEKSNLFLQAVIDNSGKPYDDKMVQWLFKRPIYDGGQFSAAADLIHKYGVVPSEAMPENHQANNTEDMREILKYKLREYGLELRRAAAEMGGKPSQESAAALVEMKQKMLGELYRLLASCLGIPPKEFEWTLRDGDGKVVSTKMYTPKSFFEEFIGENMQDDYVMIMNDPTREYGKVFEIEYYRHLYDGHNWRYINLPMETIKEIAINSIKDNCAMYFSCDSPQYRNGKTGVADFNNYRPDSLFGFSFNMDKADRIRTFTSRSVHAMSLIGVDLDDNGSAKKWFAENSFGPNFGFAGNIIMSDEWFCEFMFRLAANKKYLPDGLVTLYESAEAEILPPWDPMY